MNIAAGTLSKVAGDGPTLPSSETISAIISSSRVFVADIWRRIAICRRKLNEIATASDERQIRVS